jgi:hypothetical protein
MKHRRHCCIKGFHDHRTVRFPVLRRTGLAGGCADQALRASSPPGPFLCVARGVSPLFTSWFKECGLLAIIGC